MRSQRTQWAKARLSLVYQTSRGQQTVLLHDGVKLPQGLHVETQLSGYVLRADTCYLRTQEAEPRSSQVQGQAKLHTCKNMKSKINHKIPSMLKAAESILGAFFIGTVKGFWEESRNLYVAQAVLELSMQTRLTSNTPASAFWVQRSKACTTVSGLKMCECWLHDSCVPCSCPKGQKKGLEPL